MNNVFKFYIFNIKLKRLIRTGWLDVKISSDRLESVAEHVYGTLILAISINGEYQLKLDMEKVLKMLSLHELEEILIGDYSFLGNITKEEKLSMGKKAVKIITDELLEGESIQNLLDEFNEAKTSEAFFAHLCDKLECDLEAKIYDLDGSFDIENAKIDARVWNKDADNFIRKNDTASGIWLDSDSYLYENNELFKKLQRDIKNISKSEYDRIMQIKIDDCK